MTEVQPLIPLAALAASLLTLLSGFGLGTLLLPVFALFQPLPVAVGMTAVVHFLNNLFKAGLLWRQADRSILLRFGPAAVLGALAGATVLRWLGTMEPVYQGVRHGVPPLSMAIAALMLLFGATELSPRARAFAFTGRQYALGGLLSGFFGGLSGHQGALRSMFLLRSGLTKEIYVATGVAIALLVDLARIPLYLEQIDPSWLRQERATLVSAVAAAFLGAWAGRRLIPAVTHRVLQVIVAVLMFGIAGLLLAGLI